MPPEINSGSGPSPESTEPAPVSALESVLVRESASVLESVFVAGGGAMELSAEEVLAGPADVVVAGVEVDVGELDVDVRALEVAT